MGLLTSFHLSFLFLFAILLWMAWKGIAGGRTIFEYPTLAAMLGLAWVVPQGIELESDPTSPYASSAFWLYVAACFLFLFWGFRAGQRAKTRLLAQTTVFELPNFNLKRLLIAAAALTALGLFAGFQLRGIDTSALGSQWTGIITLWALLEKASGFGLCLAVLVYARSRSRWALAIAIVAAIPIVQAALLGVRREALFDLAILSAGSWYLSRFRFPPRSAVIACLLVGTVILNSIGDIRGRVLTGEASFLSVITSGELYRNFDFFNLGQGGASELGLARYDFWYANKTWEWEYGADYWNALAHQYVPAFLVGRSAKEDLKVSTLRERLRRGESEGLFSLGSTRTGFSDTFLNFGLLGVLVFALLGYAFGRLYVSASVGLISSQYYYLVLLAEGLKAITHSTGAFVAALPFTLIVSSIALGYARSSIGYCLPDSPDNKIHLGESH